MSRWRKAQWAVGDRCGFTARRDRQPFLVWGKVAAVDPAAGTAIVLLEEQDRTAHRVPQRRLFVPLRGRPVA